MSIELTFDGAQVLRADGFSGDPISVAEARIEADATGRAVDLTGFWVLPGIVDVHGDSFERHVAPRRGAMKDITEGLVATEAELAAQGVTTAMLAQFVSWEGGVRGPDFADKLFCALRDLRGGLVSDLRAQLRFETHMVDHYADLPAKVARWDLPYVVFNDHLPHDRLAQGRHPKGLTGKALGAGWNPDKYFDYMMELHGNGAAAKAALPDLIAQLQGLDVRLGSHDDTTEDDRAWWHNNGVGIAEFPETAEAAQAARDRGDGIILGCPNVVRGGSHKGNASALDLIAMGLCDALASDYHYPSMRRAAMLVADAGIADMADAWALVSSGPAALLGLDDRGALEVGKRADLIVMDPSTRRVCATMAGGRFSYLTGEVADRVAAA